MLQYTHRCILQNTHTDPYCSLHTHILNVVYAHFNVYTNIYSIYSIYTYTYCSVYTHIHTNTHTIIFILYLLKDFSFFHNKINWIVTLRHTHTQKHTHTHRNTETQTHTQKNPPTHTPTHTSTHTGTQPHAHTHTHTHTHRNTHTHTRTHAQHVRSGDYSMQVVGDKEEASDKEQHVRVQLALSILSPARLKEEPLARLMRTKRLCLHGSWLSRGCWGASELGQERGGGIQGPARQPPPTHPLAPQRERASERGGLTPTGLGRVNVVLTQMGAGLHPSPRPATHLYAHFKVLRLERWMETAEFSI